MKVPMLASGIDARALRHQHEIALIAITGMRRAHSR
jgi:hypothetical protein